MANTGMRTRIAYVRPTTKSGSLKPEYAIKSARLRGGLCLSPAAVVRGAAYKCTVGNEGYGWCWPIGKAAEAREVFCVEMPWEHTGTEIELGEKLKVEPAKPVEPIDNASIWGVELTSGQRCYPVRGAVSRFRGVPVDFACDGTDIELLAAPDTTRALWTIREVVAQKEAPLSQGPLGRIAVAWYGVGAAT